MTLTAASVMYYRTGGATASLAGIGLLYLHTPLSLRYLFLYTILYTISGFVLGTLAQRLNIRFHYTLLQEQRLYRHYKQLLTLRNISSALQSTLDLDRLLHILLTAIRP